MATSTSQSAMLHKSIKSLEKNQVSNNENDCTVLDLKEIRPTRVGLDEGDLRELLKHGLDSHEKIESFLIADDPEIRKAARRIKLEMRLQQALSPKEPELMNTSDVEVQLERSLTRILELLEDSRRNITAVRTVSIKEEIARQAKEKQQRDELDEMISTECARLQQNYEAINTKWKLTSDSTDILQIHESSNDCKDECQKLIDEKDKLIANLKFRLKKGAQSFSEELSKQDDYLNVLEERINDQIKVMNDCYQRELQNLQNMVNIETNEVLNERHKQWENMAGKKEQLELENTVKRYDFLQEYEEQIDSMMIEQHETMRDQKMIMENKLNKLTVEEHRYRSAVLISKELLNYNVQVLQKRQEENMAIKGQQKRIINRLQDLVRKMQQEQKREIQRLQNEKISLQEAIKNLHANVKTLNVRLNNLAVSSNQKYFQLWDYNQKVAEELIDKLIKADKKFHASLLGVSWHVPTTDFSRKSLPSYMEAKALLKELKGKTSSSYRWPDNLDKGDTKRFFNLVLDSIENKTEFLIDDTLKVFLEPLAPESRQLITINNLFDALGMRDKSDIEYMSTFFLKYIVCKGCEITGKEGEEETLKAKMVIEHAQPSPEVVAERLRRQFTVTNMVVREEFCSRGALLHLVVGDDDLIMRENTQFESLAIHKTELADENGRIQPILASVTPSKLCETDPRASEFSTGGTKPLKVRERLFCRQPGHVPLMNPMHVSRALNDFVTKLNEERKLKQMTPLKEILNQKTLTEMRLLHEKDVEKFWRNFLEVITTEKKRLMWKSLLCQIKVHYKTLLNRHSISESIKKLKERNRELKNLLSRYSDHSDASTRVRIAEQLPFVAEEWEASSSNDDEPKQ